MERKIRLIWILALFFIVAVQSINAETYTVQKTPSIAVHYKMLDNHTIRLTDDYRSSLGITFTITDEATFYKINPNSLLNYSVQFPLFQGLFFPHSVSSTLYVSLFINTNFFLLLLYPIISKRASI